MIRTTGPSAGKGIGNGKSRSVGKTGTSTVAGTSLTAQAQRNVPNDVGGSAPNNSEDTMRSPFHPGRTVRHDCLEPLGLSVTNAAGVLGVTREALRNVV